MNQPQRHRDTERLSSAAGLRSRPAGTAGTDESANSNASYLFADSSESDRARRFATPPN